MMNPAVDGSASPKVFGILTFVRMTLCFYSAAAGFPCPKDPLHVFKINNDSFININLLKKKHFKTEFNIYHSEKHLKLS